MADSSSKVIRSIRAEEGTITSSNSPTTSSSSPIISSSRIKATLPPMTSSPNSNNNSLRTINTAIRSSSNINKPITSSSSNREEEIITRREEGIISKVVMGAISSSRVDMVVRVGIERIAVRRGEQFLVVSCAVLFYDLQFIRFSPLSLVVIRYDARRYDTRMTR